MNSKSKKTRINSKGSQYQMGGDMIEPSKEIGFERPMMQKGGEKPARSAKTDERAENKMVKAKKSWTKAEQARIDSEKTPGTTGTLERYSSKMYNKAARQETRAKDLKAKADRQKEVEDVGKSRAVKKK